MSIRTFIKSLTSTSKTRRTSRRSVPVVRLSVELLEDRRVLSFAPLVDNYVGGGYVGYLGPLAAVDLNGDGRVDLGPVGSSSGTPGIHALLGNGDGTFHDGQIPGVGTYSAPVVANLNGDGIDDIVKINVNNNGDYDLRVQLGNDDGTYNETQVIVLPSQLPPGVGLYASQVPITMTLGDLNADGKRDLVASGYDEEMIDNYGATRRDHYINVLLGNGDGTFGPSSTYNVTSSDSSYNGQFILPVRDYNADGKPDVLTTGDAARLFSGAGDGTLQTPPSIFAGAWTTDVNADGKVDNVVLDYQVYYAGDDPISMARYAAVGLGNGDGSFAPPVTSNLGDGFGYRIVIQKGLADLDGDGLPELVTYETGSFGTFNCISVAHNDGIWTPPPPSLAIGDVTITEGNTGTRTASFTVTLSSASGQPVTVNYATANGSATAGSDYRATSGTLTIPAGQTTKTISVLVNGDRLAEPNETFFVNLSSPTDATLVDGQGIATILDDEPRISISDKTVTEGNIGSKNVTFTVSLSAACDVNVAVAYSTANGTAIAGSDYVAVSGTLTFSPGQTSKTVTVQVIGDRLAEANETFFINLSSPTNAAITDGQGQGTIVDDEPRISIGDVSKSEGKKNQTTLFTFTVTLSAPYDQPVTMSFRTVNGTATPGNGDYIAKTGTLTFAPGETTKTITIEVKGDSKKEANETVYLDLFGNSSNSSFKKSRGIGTILNDD